MKKLIALMLVGVMTAAMVTGCGSKKEEAAAPAETPAAEEAAEATDMQYVLDKGVLVVGITDFAPMDYKDAAEIRLPGP